MTEPRKSEAGAASGVEDRTTFSRYRFLSGLSRGIVVLAVAACFWVGLAAWGLRGDIWTLALVPVLLSVGIVAVGAVRLGKRAHTLRSSEVQVADRTSIHQITIWFRVISTAQTVFVILAGLVCFLFHRLDLLWPLIGLVVSLHFLPLGRIFRVRPYYATGVLGAVVSAVSILGFTGSEKLVALGIGLSVIMVGSSAYLLRNAERLAGEYALIETG
jgi:hypothetical protein